MTGHRPKVTLTPTREAFLTAYRSLLQQAYTWARDDDRLDKFMVSVHATISTEVKTWNHDTPVTQLAWRRINGKGTRASIARLRALPTVEVTSDDHERATTVISSSGQ